MPSQAVSERASIWVVDDSVSYRAVATDLLAALFDVEVFATGEVMLDRIARKGPPDLLLVDRELPGFTGLHVCRFVRQRHDAITLPILMLTARDSRYDFAEALKAGANDYVGKPWHDAELLTRIDTLLRMGRQHRELARERARLHFILSALDAGVTLHDASGALIFTNPAAARLLGTSEPAVSTLAAVPPRAAVPPPLTLTVKHEHAPSAVTHDEWPVRRDDGVLTWLSVSARALIDDDGADAGVVSSFVDVTDRKLASEALRRSEAEFRLLADTLPQVAWVADPAGRFTWVNGAFAQLTGRSRDALIAGDPVELLHPDDADHTLALWRQALDSGDVYAAEHRLRAADGSHRWHQARAVAVRAASGAVVRWLGVSNDIHDLREMRGELAQRDAFERELLDILKDDLAGPLNDLQSDTLALAKDGGLPARFAAPLADLESKVAGATVLLAGLLAATRLRQGGLAMHRQPVDGATVVRRALARFGIASTGRVVAGSPHGDLRGEWDPARLEDAVSHLVAHALAHGPAGSPVDVALAREGTSLVLRVHHGGAPLPASELARRFGTPPDAPGDLGLYVVKHVIDAHDGSVDVTADDGSGTTFTVRLPTAPLPTQTPDPTRAT